MERINRRRKQLRECFEEGNGCVDNHMELAVLTLDDVIELVIAAIDTAMSYTLIPESVHDGLDYSEPISIRMDRKHGADNNKY